MLFHIDEDVWPVEWLAIPPAEVLLFEKASPSRYLISHDPQFKNH
jgi:hypothetical protein